MMIAQVCDLDYGDFVHTFGDAHIYQNHFEQVDLQLSRDFRPLPEDENQSGMLSLFSTLSLKISN